MDIADKFAAVLLEMGMGADGDAGVEPGTDLRDGETQSGVTMFSLSELREKAISLASIVGHHRLKPLPAMGGALAAQLPVRYVVQDGAWGTAHRFDVRY